MNKNKLLKVRLSEEQFIELSNLSKETSYGISFIVRTIISDYIKRYKKNQDDINE